MIEKKRIVFTGGGTGGHVFPGLAIIEKLEKQDFYDTVWIGSSKGPEKDYVGKKNIPFYSVATGKFRRYISFRNISDIFKVVAGFLQAIVILRKLNIDIVVSVGGYVSVPAVYAARILRKPVISLVYDISLGLATKINAYHSSHLFFSYQHTADNYMKRKISQKQLIYCTGTPLRNGVLNGVSHIIQKKYNISDNKKILLVLGGSSGSTEINDIVEGLISYLKKDTVILHQTGIEKNDKDYVFYPNGVLHIKVGFLSDDYYGSALACSSVALSRAGTSALWELVSCAVPSVIVPLSATYSRGDQIENAKYFEEIQTIYNAGSQPNESIVREMITTLLYNEIEAKRLRERCKQYFSKNAAEASADIIHAYLQKKSL